MKRTFPQVFEASRIRPVDDYPSRLRDMLESLSPADVETPRVVVLTPGTVQLGVLRALVPRAADGRRARRGPRPRRLRRLRLDADDQGLRARRRDLPAHRRRLPRPEGLPRRLDARRAGADGRLQGGPRRARQRAGHRRRRRQGRLRLRAGRSSSTTWARRSSCPNVPTYLCADEDAAAARAGEPRRAGREGRQRVRRLRHARRPATRPATSARSSPRRIEADPRNYIAQPTLSLSRVPTIVDGTFRRPPRRSAAVHPLWRGHLRAARRPDARRAEEGLARRQLVAGRRQQGHVGARRRSASRPSGRARRGRRLEQGQSQC